MKVRRLQELTNEQQKKLEFIKGFLIMFFAFILVSIVYTKLFLPGIISEAKNEIIQSHKSEEISILTTKLSLNKGNKINLENTEFVKVPVEFAPNDLITNINEISDMVLKFDIPDNTFIIPSMLIKVNEEMTNDLRKQDYTHIRLNSNIAPKQYIDIRIKYIDGTDYLVASKKEVIEANVNLLVILINDKERYYINSATVDASLNSAELYTTIYVDPINQTPANVDYTVNPEIEKLINLNNNIIDESILKLKEENIKQE